MITNVKDLTIIKSILHIINKTSSHMNTVLLPNNDSDFNLFLKKHIRSCVNTNSRKSAIFSHKSVNNAYKYINSMFIDDNQFIENSKILANSLKGICTIKNSGPYDLIFCEYINEEDEKFLAIILLEFTKSFFHEIIESNAIIKHLNVLASNSSSFKKCVLVPFDGTNIDYDFIVNDRYATEFFLKDFLEAKLHMDDRKATETLIEQTIIWVNDKCDDPTIDDNIKEKFETVKSKCISSISDHKTIDIDAFENSVFRDEILIFKEDYNNNLENHGLINKEIILNEDVTSSYKCQKIKLDNGAEIKIPIAMIENNDYNNEYNRSRENDGDTKFLIKGKIVSEKVRSK